MESASPTEGGSMAVEMGGWKRICKVEQGKILQVSSASRGQVGVEIEMNGRVE